jgi:hypothetical protein
LTLSFHIGKKRKFIVLGLALTILLVSFILMGLWNNLKHEYQIRYHSLSIKLSGELIVSKLELSQAESFSLSIDSLAVRWHWYPLLKGQLDITQLHGNGLDLNLQPTPSEDQAEGGFLPTQVRNIWLQDVRVRLTGQEDSTEIGFTALRISEAVVQEEIYIDSLLLDEAELKYHYFPKKSDAPASADTSAFTLADLPAFSIGYLQVSRSSIAYQHAEQAHRLSKLELALNGWKSNDLLQFQLDQLAFAYQDTLDFVLHIQQGQVSEAVDTRLENIRLAFPGIALHFGALDLKTEDSLAGNLQILPSSLSFGALKRWYPAILSAMNPMIADDSLIHFAGDLSFTGEQLIFDSLAVRMLEKTCTHLLGTVDWSADTVQIDLAFEDFYSSRADLNTFLLYQDYNDFFLWPSAADGQATLKGNPDYFDIRSRLSTPEGVLSINSLVSYDEHDNLNYTIDVRSDSLLVAPLVDYLPLEIPHAQLGVAIQGLLAEDALQDYFRMELSSERIEVEGRKLQDLQFTYFFNNDYDSLWGQLRDPLATMDMRGALSGGDTSAVIFEGRIADFSSQLITDALPLQTLETHYEGAYRWQGEDFYAIELNTQNAYAQNADSILTEIPNAAMIYQEDGDQIYAVVRSNNQTVFSLQTDTSLYALATGSDNGLAQMPDTEMLLALSLDSTSMVQLTGYPLALTQSEMKLNKEQEVLSLYWNAPHLQYADAHLTQLQFGLQAREEQKTGLLTLDALQHPYFPLDSLRIDLSQSEDFYQVDVGGLLSALQEPFSFGLDLQAEDTSYTLRLDEQRPFMLAGSAWQVFQNQGLVFNSDLSLKSGEIHLKKDKALVSFNTRPDGMVHLRLDSLQLADMLYVVDTQRLAEGTFKADIAYASASGNLNWQAALNDITFSNTAFGNVSSEGFFREEAWQADLVLNAPHTMGEIHLADTGNGPAYTLDLTKLDLDILKNTAILPDNVSIKGQLSANFRGKLDSLSQSSGYLAFNNTEVSLADISSSFRLPKDSVVLHEGKLLTDILLYDVDEQPLAISGSVKVWPTLFSDLQIKSEQFRLLDENNSKADIRGSLSMRVDLALKGAPDKLGVTGKLDIRPGAYIRYLYRGSIGTSEDAQVVTFVAFDQLDQKEEVLKSSTVQNPIDWEVDLNIENANLEVILNEISQEYIKLSGGGEIRLRSGSDYLPMVYGNLSASSGRAIIFPPMVPDLDLNIESARLEWQGDPLDPSISLLGVETVKASPRGLSTTFKDRYDMVDFQVLLGLEEVNFSKLSPTFGLQSTDGAVNTFLQGLGPEQREKYAIDLLVFGSIASESEAGASRALESVVSKMNEIASRNFKRTDVSFGVVQYQHTGTGSVTPTQTSVNYQISRQLLQERMFITIGGNVGTYNASSDPNAQLIGNFEVGYRLSQKPEISIIGARKHVYEGVIDGDIIRSSVGLTYRRSYPDWDAIFRSTKEKGER